ncbi:ATP-dependent DNA helicase RecG [uncultured Tissierella sp.]|uniref:ATP-dependent DNA helicase RecG n=1 Tax=uncultured Tissierella sp. TaxID=448160 RepID=UPI00280651D8|nr:ATP-dependent DNA helicase RecG [uncultured Tissierella sp.]MDU5079840.1 ATP-dependent DNA helicase RecG [Bacillota bacterium]
MAINIQYLKGVGPKRASRLRKLNINTVEDLMYFIPRDYDDRSKFKTLRECMIGEKVSLEVEIIGKANILRPRRNLSIIKVPVKDSSHNAYLVWFNQEYLKDKFIVGEKIIVNGKINKVGMEIQIMSPVFEKSGTMDKVGRITPIYSLTEGLTNNEIIKIIDYSIKEYIDQIREFLPQEIINKYDLMDIRDAITNVHFPMNSVLLEKARKRLSFQELLTLQMGLFIIKNRNFTNNKGIRFNKTIEINDFIQKLPFKLTNSQIKVFKEIEADMENDIQMNRLVQGDVGSGKTIIAVLAMFKAISSGYQAVMMAPTEILASQHFESIRKFFSGYNIRTELLVGSLSPKAKEEILLDLKEGRIDILIGTHAVIQENVEFNRLGLAITDEQHRFGVKQRAILSQKGNNPDVIVMTATPIPRTLALILYGDLDVSIIDELPPGRKEIETYAVGPEMIERINNFIRKQILESRQAYIVCPLIEESETLTVNAAEELYKDFKDNIFKEFKVGLLHGKMKPKEKDLVMEEFKNHKIDILVSTTVIEVGVNVPNSNIMVIYNAERFGLAQLHQLRGRVGRGEHQSYCILINESNNQISRERMRVLQNSTDGFKISEKDLELRGPGEFFGTRQHGLPELKVANLFTDMDILKVAQKEAINIVNQDPNLEQEKYRELKKKIQEMFSNLGEYSTFN